MKKTSTIKRQNISDEAPPITQADFDRAQFRVGGKQATRAEWQTAVRGHIAKHRVNILLDAPIVEYFKELAGGRGYQTLINDTLRRTIAAEKLETDLRKIIREELSAIRVA